MNRHIRAHLVLMLSLICGLLVGCAHDPAYFEDKGTYYLGTGDKVRVIVFDQVDLSNDFNVDSTGRISVPLVGPIKVRGKTTRQIEYSVIAALEAKNLVKDPKVAVEVIEYRPFYIIGEVKLPSKYPFVNGITIEKAVAIAGGYTIYANKRRIFVTRQQGEELVTYKVKPLDKVYPGDTINITERWF